METVNARINQIKEYIMRGETQKACDLAKLTLTSFETDEFNEVKKDFYLLQARYNSLQTEKRRGTLSIDQFLIEKSKIDNELLGATEDFRIKTERNPNQGLSTSIKESDVKDKEPEVKIIRDPKVATAPKRTEIIVQNLKVLVNSQNYGLVREKSNFSTFSIPNRGVDNPIWDHIKFKDNEKKEYTKLLSSQRGFLEKHSFNKSCKLIVHLEDGLRYKTVKHSFYRMKTLLEFLKTNRDRVDIVNVPRTWSEENKKEFENLLIVGDYDNLENCFYAYSISASQSEGIKDTYISPEPKEVANKIKDFDTEFRNILKYLDLDIYEARNEVIDWLEKKIKEIGLQS